MLRVFPYQARTEPLYTWVPTGGTGNLVPSLSEWWCIPSVPVLRPAASPWRLGDHADISPTWFSVPFSGQSSGTAAIIKTVVPYQAQAGVSVVPAPPVSDWYGHPPGPTNLLKASPWAYPFETEPWFAWIPAALIFNPANSEWWDIPATPITRPVAAPWLFTDRMDSSMEWSLTPFPSLASWELRLPPSYTRPAILPQHFSQVPEFPVQSLLPWTNVDHYNFAPPQPLKVPRGTQWSWQASTEPDFKFLPAMNPILQAWWDMPAEPVRRPAATPWLLSDKTNSLVTTILVPVPASSNTIIGVRTLIFPYQQKAFPSWIPTPLVNEYFAHAPQPIPPPKARPWNYQVDTDPLLKWLPVPVVPGAQSWWDMPPEPTRVRKATPWLTIEHPDVNQTWTLIFNPALGAWWDVPSVPTTRASAVPWEQPFHSDVDRNWGVPMVDRWYATPSVPISRPAVRPHLTLDKPEFNETWTVPYVDQWFTHSPGPTARGAALPQLYRDVASPPESLPVPLVSQWFVHPPGYTPHAVATPQDYQHSSQGNFRWAILVMGSAPPPIYYQCVVGV